MAIRLARSSAASSSSSSQPLFWSAIRRSAANIFAPAVGGCELPMAVRVVTFSSYSSSCSFPETSAAAASTRREQKITDRLSAAIDAVSDRKLPPELRGVRNSVRSETDIINVVERRIWHSMEKGEFENLRGKGKPLTLDTNPHADPADETLYRILNQGGFAPEWVELNREIRSKVHEWRAALKRARTIKITGDQSEWTKRSETLKTQLRDINMVFKYNLIAPFGRQMFGMKWEKELDRLEE